MQGLKLGEIVTLARLNVHSAAHVLKHAWQPLALPEAGGSGVHRRFDTRQAVRLSIVSKLVNGSLTLDPAVEAVRYCERRVAALARRDRSSGPLYDRRLSDPWMLRVHDERLIHIWCAGVWRAEKPLDASVWIEAATGTLVYDEELPEPIGSYDLNLTALERALAT